MTHALRYAANCSMLFTELPLLQRPAAAKSAGFDAIEAWWPFITSVPADAEIEDWCPGRPAATSSETTSR